MAKKKSEQIGQGIGAVIGLAMVAAVLAAALLPLYLLGALVKNLWISRKLRKDFPAGGKIAWLTETERQRFKQIHPDCIALREFVEVATERSERPGLSRNKDGSLDLRNSGNKKLTHELDEARQLLKRLETEFENLEYKTFLQWHELNDVLKKCSRMWMALFGWLIGAAFFYSKFRAGAPIDIWIDFFMLAICAGGGVLFAMAFSRYPAGVHSPMPAPVNMDNVDSPEIQRPMHKRSKVLQFAGAFAWSALMITAYQIGNELGADQAIAYRQRINSEQALKIENEEFFRNAVDSKRIATNSEATASPGILLEPPPPPHSKSTASDSAPTHIDIAAIDGALSSNEIARMDMGEVENMVLAIYARHGAGFESLSAQRWVDQQPWYRRVAGRTIKDAERTFSPVTQNRVNQLIARWNEIQVDEGLAPVPIDESPLAGRSVSPDIEKDTASGSPVVLKAFPLHETSTGARENLNREEIQGWNLARVKFEINQIYARHGVVFSNQEIQEHFEKQAWYKPVPGLTFDQAEEEFSINEREDITALAGRRTMLTVGNQPQTALPVSEPLRPDQVATWDAARVRTEINTIYASYGVDFTNAELRKWADRQPGYKCVQGRTFADAEAFFSDTVRSNIELLATRRGQISTGN